MPKSDSVVRLAAVADIHCNAKNQDMLRDLFRYANAEADILVLCGDLADTGLVEEAKILSSVLNDTVKVPMVGVLGNHDFQNGRHEEVRHILCKAGIALLDGEILELCGVWFAGVKGFCGGFGRFQLEGWGEKPIKRFVQESLDEAFKLELALARLGDTPRVAIMHYAPIRDTVVGESPEIFPFLGSSRLEQPVNWFEATLVIHGHAHNGTPNGLTFRNIPVYNVSLPVLRKAFPGQPPVRILEVGKPDI